ncbi:MAG: iron ABC transporter permease [Rhodospirillales bacterium]
MEVNGGGDLGVSAASPISASLPGERRQGPPVAAAAAHLRPVRLGLLSLLPLALLLALLAAPITAIVVQGMAAPDGYWQHLLATVFLTYVTNTIVLCLGVGGIAAVAGTGTAWLISMYRFPGRRWLEWALILPLAMPAYVLAYAYTDALQVTGPVQSFLRHTFGLRPGTYPFFEIRSLGGAVFVLGFALYPYVYLLARAAFSEQSGCALEVSRTLGCSPWSAFRRVALPAARPAIATGVAFAVMETLADFGAVKYFEVQTYTTGIYRAWYGTANPTVAAQLASLLLLFVFVALAAERLSRRAGRHRHTGIRHRAMAREPLAGAGAAAAVVACALPIAFGFALPAISLLMMTQAGADDAPSVGRLVTLAGNTLLLGALASAVIVGCAIVALYSLRAARPTWHRLAMLLISLGYATPGVVIAVGILITIGVIDRFLGEALWQSFGIHPGLILGGTLAAVVYGCLTRFFAVAYGPLEAALAKIKPSYEDAARLLRGSQASVLRHVHLPMMRPSLIAAALIVFVEVMKELPATMILRPFNFDTLATEAFQLATTERLDAAAVPSLLIVAAGLVPVVILCREIRRSRQR